MDYLIYLFFRFGVFLFRLMPFRILYAFSDFVFIIVYHIAKYRRNVVFNNLQSSFPEKKAEELHKIERKFYHHFCDVLLESIKVFSVPTEKVAKRYRFYNTEMMDKLAEEGIPVICVTGHYNNWEWGGIASDIQMKHRAIGFYKPLSNKYIDAFVAKNRARGKNRVASIEKTQQTFKDYSDIPSVFYMIADQSPPSSRMVHWVRFLNHDTAVISGPDRYARILNMPVFYAHVRKIKRGWYEVDFRLLCENPGTVKSGEVTAGYMRMLEESILEDPANYLWSHRRWKHKKPDSVVIPPL